MSGPLTVLAADSGQPLTLGVAVATALKHNPQIAAARSEETASTHKTIAARSGLLPQVYASETYNHTNSPLWAFGTKLNQGVIQGSDFNPDALNDPDPVDNFATALSLSWNLYDGGRTWSALGERSKHVDNHAIWIDPENTDYYLVGCDGGVYESFDRGANYRFFENLPITQFYRDDDLFLENNLPDFHQLQIPLYLGRSTYAVLDADVEFKHHFVRRGNG